MQQEMTAQKPALRALNVNVLNLKTGLKQQIDFHPLLSWCAQNLQRRKIFKIAESLLAKTRKPN